MQAQENKSGQTPEKAADNAALKHKTAPCRPQKKIPQRKCLGCGESKNKSELIRVVRLAQTKTVAENGADGQVQSENEKNPVVVLDFTGKKSGRGAYICRSAACFRKARRAKRLEKSLECEIPEEVYDALENELEKNEHSKG